MSKCIKKMKYTAQVVLERVTKRESDVSDQETTEKASVACPVDSMEEDGDVVRVKVKLESDTEWEPATQTKKKDETTSGSEDEENPNPFWPRARARANARASAGASARARARARARASARGRGSVRRSRGRRVGGSDRDQTSAPGAERWCSVDEPDITPPQPTFCPSRPPGPQLIKTASYSAVELFQLFFTNASLLTIVQNTNEYGRAHCTSPSSAWTDITLQDMFSFLSVVLYMGVVKCPNLTDYWRGGNLYNLPFPQSVIPGKKWLRILQALHLSSKEDEVANEERRGTPAFDRLGRIKPLYEEMREACRRNFHPSQEIAIDERMVASKARVFQYMKSKPVRWGFKLFVLADSSNGYTWDFFVYEGKSENTSGRGLGYDSVMKLVNPSALGTGYKLFVDNFYTIPVLFDDLLKQRIWACGAIRTSRAGFPKTALNALEPACPRGTVRWLRKGSLLFVQWRDTKDVSLCSTMHTAHGSEKINRKIKIEGGGWSVQGVPLPPAIKDYNRCMGRVDVSDARIGYYQVLHKTRRWYKTFFYHFIDIAVVNAFLLHKELCKAKGQVPMNQKVFRETLAEQLMGLGTQRSVPAAEQSAANKPHHLLVYISDDRTDGRLKCRMCHSKTAVKCGTCNKPLCFVPQRNCYNKWHTKEEEESEGE